MANEAQLSVSIVAEIDQLRDSFNQAIRETNVFDKSTSAKLKQIDKNFESFANRVDKSLKLTASSSRTASNSISKDLAKAASVTASSGQAISSGSNRAAFALTNLGRVAQDAPFGFIGIQNNINPLLESFQSLQKESGSTSGALKELGKSLIGPAGLGIALSVVGAAILFYQQYQQRAKKSTEELSKANDSYIKSLSQVEQAQLGGAQAAQKEIVSLNTLFSVYQNSNLPLKQRKEAYQEIQNLYPEYFKNIKFEENASDRTSEAYNRLSKSIIATAKARAAQDLIVKNSSKELEIEKQMVDLQAQRVAAEKEASKVISQRGTYSPTGGGGVAATLNLGKEQRDIDKEIIDLAKQRNDLRKESTRLEKFVTDQIVNGADITSEANKNAEDSYKRTNTEALNINKTLEEENKLREEGLKTITAYLSKLSGADGANSSALSDQIVPVPLEFQFTPTETTSPADLLLQRLQEEFGEKFQKDVNSLMNDSLGRAFGDSFSALGEALANGGNPIEAFGKSVIQGFGSFLSEFGGLLIKYGIAATAYGKLQAALLTPGGAIIAGPLAIAAGLALKIASGAINGLVSGQGSQQDQGYQPPRFANGVTNFAGGMALVGERGPELVTLPTGSNVITNENVVRLARNNGGGTQRIEVVGRLDGQDIALSVARSTRATNRVT